MKSLCFMKTQRQSDLLRRRILMDWGGGSMVVHRVCNQRAECDWSELPSSVNSSDSSC